MRGRIALVAGLAAMFGAQPAFAKCSVSNFGLLQVSMQGNRPLTQAEINGHPVRFIVDSGAFFSTLSPAVARELDLTVASLPPDFRMSGVGGDVSAGLAKVAELKLAGVPLKGVNFVVGGSDTGVAGLIGQNVLGLRDAEFDLQHGAVRLMEAKDCGEQSLAYWANGKPVTTLATERMTDSNRHIIATVLVNGVRMRALFDTGAGGTVISIKAAKRAGVTPDSPGAVKAGYARGVGSRQVQIWRAPFDSIDLGGERLRHAIFTIQELGGDIDMLIGVDFFLSHRVYVANSQDRLFFTYEGGPVFGVNPTMAVTDQGEKIALKDSGTEPSDAAGYSARGTASAAKHDYASALADLDRAVALAPDNGHYYYQRAQVRLALRQQPLAVEDMNMAKALAPADPEILLTHGTMSLARRDRPAAMDDARAADGALAQEAQARLSLAQLYATLGNREAALANFETWLRFHGEDSQRPAALNGRCYSRAVLNRDLDKAISDCNTAIRLLPNTAAFYDSRAFLHLRRGENQEAVDDYTTALNLQPNLAMPRYLRGVAETKLGQADAAKRDRDAAAAIDPRIASAAAQLGY